MFIENIAMAVANQFKQGVIDKACEWIETHLLHAEAAGYMTTDLFKQFKQFMEE